MVPAVYASVVVMLSLYVVVIVYAALFGFTACWIPQKHVSDGVLCTTVLPALCQEAQ